MSPAPTLLCVDDEQNILSALRRVFRPHGYRVLTSGSGAEAIALMQHEIVDVIISDMRMPGMDGATLLEQARLRWPDTTRILLTGHADIDATVGAINRGEVHRYVSKPWTESELLLIVRQAIERKELLQEKSRLEEITRQQNARLQDVNAELELRVAQRTAELKAAADALSVANSKLKSSFITSIRVFSKLIEMREAEQAGHSRRVADMARKIAVHMGIAARDAHDIFIAGLLHDVGKIGLPDAVLRDPSTAPGHSPPAAYRKYPVRSEQALMPLEDLRGAATIIRAHCERFDGRGFPDGRAGIAIPMGARILGLCKDYDTLQINKAFRQRMTADAARDFIVLGRTTRYDPDVVSAFLAVVGGVDAAPPPDARTTVADLIPGMVLSRDLVTHDGVLLLTAERVLDENVVARIRDYEASDTNQLLIYVHAARAAEDASVPAM